MYMNHLLSQWYAFTLKFVLVCFIILGKQSKACISVILLPKIADWYLATGNTKVENVSNEIAVPTCRSLEYCYFSGMKLLSIAVTRISWISFLTISVTHLICSCEEALYETSADLKFITRPLIKSFGFETACSTGVSQGLGNFKKFTIIYLTHHVWFGVTVCVLWGGGGGTNFFFFPVFSCSKNQIWQL